MIYLAPCGCVFRLDNTKPDYHSDWCVELFRTCTTVLHSYEWLSFVGTQVLRTLKDDDAIRKIKRVYGDRFEQMMTHHTHRLFEQDVLLKHFRDAIERFDRAGCTLDPLPRPMQPNDVAQVRSWFGQNVYPLGQKTEKKLVERLRRRYVNWAHLRIPGEFEYGSTDEHFRAAHLGQLRVLDGATTSLELTPEEREDRWPWSTTGDNASRDRRIVAYHVRHREHFLANREWFHRTQHEIWKAVY